MEHGYWEHTLEIDGLCRSELLDPAGKLLEKLRKAITPELTQKGFTPKLIEKIFIPTSIIISMHMLVADSRKTTADVITEEWGCQIEVDTNLSPNQVVMHLKS
ncbi:MAG: hypothetical protein HKM05_10525 [Spirochaetales bacterium]|nr:hypothetical protein [Spirochaetales bacterium]